MGLDSKTSASFRGHFDALKGPRVGRRQRHLLGDVPFLAVRARIAGANDFVAMRKFGRAKRDRLKKFLELPNGIPSHDTLGRALSPPDGEQFIRCFLGWVRTIHRVTAGEAVAVDGKTARVSLGRAKGQNPLHVVGAWASANRVVPGEVLVDDKSNGITAIPKPPRMPGPHGAIVTIDAMGRRKGIAAKIRERGADYVPAVKGNQEHPEEDVVAHFAALDEGGRRPRRRGRTTRRSKGRGRAETRRYDAAPAPATPRHREEWKGPRSPRRVTRAWTGRGEEKSEVRSFIGGLPADATALAKAILGHRGIENGPPWVLGTYFGEDRGRARTAAAANLAVPRRWIATLPRQDKTPQDGVEKKRLQAGWNEAILERFLGLS